MIKQIITLFLSTLMLIPTAFSQEEEEEEFYEKGMALSVYNSNRGWGGALGFIYGSGATQWVISLDLQYLKDSREALTAPFIGDQGKRYVFGKLNNFWNLSPMFGIYHQAVPRGNGNLLKMRLGAKVGPAIGVLNAYHVELYEAVPGRPFSPEFVVVPYNPDEHSFGEIVGRAGIWSSNFNPTVQLGFSTHLNAMVDFSRSDAVIRGIELGVNADIFFKEVPILAEINGIQNRKVYLSVSAGLVLGGRW